MVDRYAINSICVTFVTIESKVLLHIKLVENPSSLDAVLITQSAECMTSFRKEQVVLKRFSSKFVVLFDV